MGDYDRPQKKGRFLNRPEFTESMEMLQDQTFTVS